MKFFPAPPKRDDELCLDQQSEMFRDPLPGHLQVLAKLIQGLAILGMELIEQGATTGIGQGFEDGVHGERIMQPNGCILPRHRKFPCETFSS